MTDYMFCTSFHLQNWQNNFRFTTRNKTNNRLSNFGLIEESMDPSCILLAVKPLRQLYENEP